MKRRILGISLVVALVAVVAVGATLAYFTGSAGVVKNTFTMGNVSIKLDEADNTKTDGTRTEAGNDYTNVTPGVAVAKDPTVTNTGANDAWVRVNVTISEAAAWDAALTKNNITGGIATIFSTVDTTKWTAVAPVTADDKITLTYYYNTVVAAGIGTTGALFTGVTIPSLFDNDDIASIEGFEITITADAIQTDAAFTTAQGAFANFVA